MKGRTLLLVAGLWGLALGGGVAAYHSHAATAGAVAETPARWPAKVAFEQASDGYTVVMFVHPDCPCTRASLTELRQALRGVTAPRLVFVASSAVAFDFDGARVVIDDGHLARAFGATTSGFTVAYDATGALRYAGGVTESRGHVGPNVGARSLHALLDGKTPALDHQATFGCSLEDRS